MGKNEDLCASPRLRCVHCHNTETPLWRSGPDGPKTLCNACGVRFKKGKLALFKDKNGNLTAVQSENSYPVVLPQASNKKTSKKIATPRLQACPQESKRVVRKAFTETPIATAVAKKPRVRARRTTAGQLPGRYASKSVPDDLSQWRSSSASPSTGPSSPVASPDEQDDHRPGLLSSPMFLNLDEPSLYQFNDTEDDNMVPDFAFLGLGSDANSQNATVLPMPADPSSTEQFSFAFAELGRDASLAIDLPDRIEALRALVQEKQVSKCYDVCVESLASLWIQQRRPKSKDERRPAEYLKEFIRSLILQQDPTCAFSSFLDVSGAQSEASGVKSEPQSPIMLPERALYVAATESITGLMDNVQMVGFAETCLIELLAEDVHCAVVEKRNERESHNFALDKKECANTATTMYETVAAKA